MKAGEVAANVRVTRRQDKNILNGAQRVSSSGWNVGLNSE